MGKSGYTNLLKQRKELFLYTKTQLELIAIKYGEKVLHTPNNNISIGMSLSSICLNRDPNYLGSMLFSRGCSGVRVIATSTTKKIGKFSFTGYGAHCNSFPCSYLTVAAAIGIKKEEVDGFMKRLDKTIREFMKKKKDSVDSPSTTTKSNTEATEAATTDT